MNAFVPARFRAAARALTVPAALFLAACLGGTGTDTENGFEATARVLDLEGRPAAGLLIAVRPWAAEPDSAAVGDSLPASVDSGTAFVVTDSLGIARFLVPNGGPLVAQGGRGGNVLLLSAFLPLRSDTIELRMDSLIRVTGAVRLFSAFRPDTGAVMVRGTSLTAPVSPGGGFDLGLLPRGVLELGVGARTRARPLREAFVKIARAASPLVDERFEIDSLLRPDGSSNLTLFKASAEGTDLCLADGGSAVQGVSVKGSLRKPEDVRRAAGWACGTRTGARVRVESADADGRVTGRLGEFITPDRTVLSVWGGQIPTRDPLRLIAPARCRLPEDRPRYGALFVAKPLEGAVDVHVDDLANTAECSVITAP